VIIQSATDFLQVNGVFRKDYECQISLHYYLLSLGSSDQCTLFTARAAVAAVAAAAPR
jgi:hypothetical protein